MPTSAATEGDLRSIRTERVDQASFRASIAFTAWLNERRGRALAGARVERRDLDVACHGVASAVGFGGWDCLWCAPDAAGKLGPLFSVVVEGIVAVEVGDRRACFAERDGAVVYVRLRCDRQRWAPCAGLERVRARGNARNPLLPSDDGGAVFAYGCGGLDNLLVASVDLRGVGPGSACAAAAVPNVIWLTDFVAACPNDQHIAGRVGGGCPIGRGSWREQRGGRRACGPDYSTRGTVNSPFDY
jgi:hypothetical protein